MEEKVFGSTRMFGNGGQSLEQKKYVLLELITLRFPRKKPHPKSSNTPVPTLWENINKIYLTLCIVKIH